MTETDTSREDYGLYDGRCVAGCQHYHGGEIRHHPDCGHYPDSLTRVNADKIASLLARAEKAEADLADANDRANKFATKEYHTEMRAKKAEAERDTAWNDAIEAAAECVGHITQSEDRDAVMALRKGEPT